MKKNTTQADFWYAVQNTTVVIPPKKTIETFGNTIIQYHLISELMDIPGKVRIREGRLQAFKPLIIVPDPSHVQTDLEGFGEQAKAYMEWLKQNAENLRLLQYGYTLKQEAFSEQVVTDSVKNVVDRVSQEVKSANNPFDAVVVGVDEPWDVCLVRLFWLITVKSAPENIREFEKERELELRDGIPMEVRREVEQAFAAAEQDSRLVKALGELLQKRGVFDHYQDRFFRLV